MTREFICDALGLAALTVTTIVVLWLPAILHA
ncbi:hypothetical protein SAMN05444959_103254 [Paracoccus seriniphilus]|uniref:Uncharacterized protein n=1 Tax=Paracoccus seriniphilus TaxID=184748 RepID=A0A239PR21_9RHOB|nr:hypothetical protein SAMN05444959_103254 [Paracoccus seriniphilus]